MLFFGQRLFFRLFLSFIIALFSPVKALSSSELPNYCSTYPAFVNGEIIRPDTKYTDDIIFKGCLRNNVTDFKTKNLSTFVEKIESHTLTILEKQFEDLLQSQAIKQLLNKKSEYHGLYNQINYKTSPKLLNCGLKSVEHKYPSDKSKQKDFMALNIINGIKALALFDLNKNYYQESSDIQKKRTWSLNQCQQKKLRCRKKTPIYKNTKHCSHTHDQCVQKVQRDSKKQQTLLDQKIAPLFEMVGSSPLLFNNANEGSFKAIFDSYELRPSPLLKNIKRILPTEAINKMKGPLKEMDRKGIDQFYHNNAETIHKLINSNKVYAQLQSETDKELSREFRRLDQAIFHLCQGKNENLHHYPKLVQATFTDILTTIPSHEHREHQITASQVAYCQLLRNKPLKKNKTSFAAISGLTLLGVGATLQIIPILGNFSGGYLLTVGTGLALTGGSVLTGVGVLDTKEAHEGLNQEIGLHSAGFHGYSEVLASKKIRDQGSYWLIADSALFAFDLQALRSIHKISAHKKSFVTSAKKARHLKWVKSLKPDWGKKIKLKTSNGVEIEGILQNQTIEKLTGQLANWLQDHPSGLVKNIDVKALEHGDFSIHFTFDNKNKMIQIEQETLNRIENNELVQGVELVSHLLETPDDIRLFFELQKKFYNFGVKEDTLVAGIHNHNGLLKLIGREIENSRDKEIIEFADDFQKIEFELMAYFGTHPYRNSLSGRSKEKGSIATSSKKNQGLVLSKARGKGNFKTLEIRIFNAKQDPNYLAEAINFNNTFLSAYFDRTSGLKKWMNSSREIKLKDLFKKLGLNYKKKKHHYPVDEMMFDTNNDYLSVFGTNLEMALKFLEQHMLINIRNPQNKINSFGELYHYLTYLKSQNGELNESNKKRLRTFVKKMNSYYRAKGERLYVSDTMDGRHFIDSDPSLKKQILDLFWPQGILKAPEEEIIKLLKGDFYNSLKNYPFREKEYDYLYDIAKKNNNAIGASSILMLKHPDLNKHILELQEIKGDFLKRCYLILADSTTLLSPQAKAHIINVLKKNIMVSPR